MVYQNNNSRINPDAVVDARLNPSAQPTNQEIRYRDESQDKLKKSAALAEGLIALGQGTVAINPVIQRHAMDAVEKARLEAGQNKDDWNTVSRNIPALSKFNPYLKDSYQQLQFQDIENAAIAKFNGIKDKHALDETEYLKKRNEVYQEMMQAAKVQGIKYQNYAPKLMQFDQIMQRLDSQYYSQHAEYMQNKVWNKIGFNTNQKLISTLYTSTNKVSDMKGILDEYVVEMTNTGASDETIVKNITTQLASYIMDNPEDVDSKTLRAALTGLKVNGRDISEVDNTFITNVNKLCKDAITAKYAEDEAKWNYESAKASHDIHIAQGDYFKWEQQNPNATMEQKMQKATELCNSYNLQNYAGSWFGATSSLENSLINMSKTHSDPNVLDTLGKKAVEGSLTVEDVENNRDYLNYTDYGNLHKLVDTAAGKTNTSLKTLAQQMFFQKNPQYTLDKQDYKKLQDEYNNLNIQLANNEIDNITYQQKLNQLIAAGKYASSAKNIQSRNVNDILVSSYQNKNVLRIHPENINTINSELSKLGMLKGSNGVTLKDVKAEEAYTQSRKATGKPHLGIDVAGVYKGQSIYCPYNAGGTLVASGFEDTMGYYAVVKQGSQYIKLMHLNGLPQYKVGEFIPANKPIGYVGNSGTVRGNSCLHIEFWNSKLQWSTISDYRRNFGVPIYR